MSSFIQPTRFFFGQIFGKLASRFRIDYNACAEQFFAQNVGRSGQQLHWHRPFAPRFLWRDEPQHPAVVVAVLIARYGVNVQRRTHSDYFADHFVFHFDVVK
jgi:hypothetical protein